MNQGPNIRNPQEINWVHQTISPKFTQGGPDPKRRGQFLPGENVLTVADNLRRGKISYNDFPALQVFTITDPDENVPVTFSLSNRRLTAFRASNVDSVKTTSASFNKVHQSLWKMTSVNGGFDQPKMTQCANITGAKDCRPADWTTLGKFRNYMEAKEAKYNNPAFRDLADPTKYKGDTVTDAFIEERLARRAVNKFHLR